ncbi:Dolichyl-diphosphooligosaccharide--protein glycosyltransferase subunit 3B like [Actinidia chinensis var. chinensis]|uniref:Dolichyl-diphosphooligosaccharide--protein glycosyltransferase subunit 3B like n=1 Tax=Actinidia chinensis var. chinensis TaxID=1590841 RepID=A0A2R6RAY7_ACTCC|nr:Dolichyl-diphosphooligosaccharide--protein glycosyltransferase subunit 3B like [Actinidia chinensis var. chinensis]
MAISNAPLSLLLTLVFSLLSPSSPTSSDLVADLLTLESQSPSGVIRLSDPLISRFLTSAAVPRPFSLLIFFDAAQLHDKSELQLKSLRSEFALLASSFIANNAHDPSSLSKLFFCDLEFRDAQSSFSLFGVNALPHIRLVPATARNLKDDSHQMDAGDFSRLAESMAKFVESKTKLTIGPIHRPPIVSKTQWTVLIAAFLICVPFVVKKLISGDTLLHDPKVWLAGSVFVYFFSVSGAMHNIIRNMPMFMADRNDPSKLVFFYQGSGMQLGAEGFAVGFLYTIVGLLLAFVTHVLVRVRNVTVQRLVMIVALLVSFWAVKKVVFLDNWKTGYGIHMYWPSSWQ